MSVKVLIADDHDIIRIGLSRLIKEDNTFEVIDEASDGQQAYEKIKSLTPDIVLMDISMPMMSGLEVAKKIRSENINVKIIILTMHTSHEFFDEALNLNVEGYVLKENTINELMTALRRVSEGKRFISPLLTEYLMENNKNGNLLNLLSPAEKRVFKLISENETSKEIAHELNLSYRTVQNHRANICEKLNLQGMNALLQFAMQNKSNT